jgi:hypothetical protein
MKSGKSVFTDFNFSFITFPRQVFVNIFDGNNAAFYSLTQARALAYTL